MTNDLSKYGPGDEITWPPCTNHSLDPRTPPDSDLEEARAEEVITHMSDPDYICEGIAGASEQELKLLSAALIEAHESVSKDTLAVVGLLVYGLLVRYCEPPEDWTPGVIEPDEPEEDLRMVDEDGQIDWIIPGE